LNGPADVDVEMQIVDKTIMEADKDRDGKISFEEFTKMVENTDVSMSMTLGKFWSWNTKQSWCPPFVHHVFAVLLRRRHHIVFFKRQAAAPSSTQSCVPFWY